MRVFAAAAPAKNGRVDCAGRVCAPVAEKVDQRILLARRESNTAGCNQRKRYFNLRVIHTSLENRLGDGDDVVRHGVTARGIFRDEL